MSVSSITASDIKRVRDETGMSLLDASSFLRKQQMIAMVEESETVEQLKYVLFSIINNTTFR